MRIRFVISVITVLAALSAVSPSWADSSLVYPDNSRSQAISLGGGAHGFVFFDIPGDNDIFVHPVDFNANLLLVTVSNTFTGFALWLDFEGFSGNFLQYGVYTCNGSSFSCAFGSRRGTLFL